MNENNQGGYERDYYELDMLGVFRILFKFRAVIIALAVVFALGLFVKTAYFTDYTYSAGGVLYVSNRSEMMQSGVAQISKSDIDAAKTLSETYIEILKTQDFLENVSSITMAQTPWTDISEMMDVSIVNDTELIKITVTTESPELSYDIASSIIRQAPEKLIGIYETGKVEVVNSVHMPQEPNDRGVLKNTVLGLILGLVLGVLYAFVMNFLDKKVRSSQDISRKYNVSILGELSHVNKGSTKKKNARVLKLQADNILNEKSSFDVVETYKSMRTKIMFSMPKSSSGRVIALTSSQPSEGKTTTIINLALTFAQTGAKVLLIDCDLRKPRIHRYLQSERGIGLSNLLCGFCTIEEAVNENVKDNLNILTAGEIPPNPAELLESEEFENLIAELKNRYDYIFIDTPPMTVVTDAEVIMPKCNGAVVVVRENTTTFDLLDETIEGIKKTNTKIFGVVVLDSSQKHVVYGHYNR